MTLIILYTAKSGVEATNYDFENPKRKYIIPITILSVVYPSKHNYPNTIP